MQTEGPMDRAQLLEIASAILVPIASSFYAINIIRGKIDPPKAVWLVWGTIASLIALGMWKAGTLNWQALVVAIADIVILVLVLWRSKEWKWSKFDMTCMALAACAIISWQQTGDPRWALVFSLAGSVIGSLPLYHELWKDPAIEKPLPWLIMACSSVLELAALGDWSWTFSAQPLVYLVVPAIVVVLTQRRKRISIAY